MCFRLWLQILLLTAIPSSLLATEPIYTFTDSDGSLSFTDTPSHPEAKRYYLKEEIEKRTALPAHSTATYRPSIPSTPSTIDALINTLASRFQLDPLLVRAIIKTESNFNPQAISHKGAQGLMQLMPETARLLKVENPFDPRENIQAGVRYFRSLLRRFQGDLPVALAAYNAGPTTVQRYGGIPPYPETIHYIEQVLLYYRQLKSLS